MSSPRDRRRGDTAGVPAVSDSREDKRVWDQRGEKNRQVGRTEVQGDSEVHIEGKEKSRRSNEERGSGVPMGGGS